MSFGALGLTMDEIQQVIADASEQTPDIRPDGAEMGDPEYVTAYMLNIVIPLIQYNNLRIEEQLLAIGIRVPTRGEIEDALLARQAERERTGAMGAIGENGEFAQFPAFDQPEMLTRAAEIHDAADSEDGLPDANNRVDDETRESRRTEGGNRPA